MGWHFFAHVSCRNLRIVLLRIAFPSRGLSGVSRIMTLSWEEIVIDCKITIFSYNHQVPLTVFLNREGEKHPLFSKISLGLKINIWK